MRNFRRNGGIVVAALMIATLSACGSDEDPDSGTTPEQTSEEMTSEPMDETSEPMEEETTEETPDDDMAMGDLVGAGCATYAEMVPDGEGSVEGMADDPVSVAASNNPLLTQLVAAVSGGINPNVDLVSTIDGGEFTIFAPVDDAFGALDQATLDAVAGDDGTLLSTVLTYHVVEGQIAPADIVGTHPTVQGEDVTVEGSGDELTVNGANVICGGVTTTNATVYLIDQVLMPPSMG